jgi:hypothetical protein
MLVWNMHCFANKSQKNKFQTNEDVKSLELSEIANIFKKYLKSKNQLPSVMDAQLFENYFIFIF